MEHLTFLYIYLAFLLPVSLLQLIVPFLPDKAMNYSPNTLSCNLQAVKRGYPYLLVRFMVSFQHLTIWTMLLATVYLLSLALGGMLNDDLAKYAAVTCFIRPILPGAGVIVAQYWSFIFTFGPWSLVPREEFSKNPEEALRIAQCLFMYPSATPYILFYLLMHIQHTFIPLMPWVEELWFPESVYSVCPRPSIWSQTFQTVSYLLLWLVWGFSCWYVRGRPPYPIVKEVHDKGSWPYLYGGMLLLAVIACRINHTFFSSGQPVSLS